ncbi:MAG: ECF transporter S component [Chloroflexota bacterium]
MTPAQRTVLAQERSIRRIITAGLLLAITLLLVFSRLGMIPVPTPAANATIAHIPAIVAGILEGPVVGFVVGLGFGFASFSAATIPMFKDPLVAILPRLFIGITAAYTAIALRKASKPVLNALLAVLLVLALVFAYEVARSTLWLGIVVAVVAVAGAIAMALWMRQEDVRIVGLAIAAAVGSLTNTALVLSAAVWRGYIPAAAAWGIGVTHGIPEVIVSAVVTVAVVAALRQIGGRRRGSRL